MVKLCGANWRSSRIDSPSAVPPGSRVTRSGTPQLSRRLANVWTCVDFPHPSDPSNVMNGRRGTHLTWAQQWRFSSPKSGCAYLQGATTWAAVNLTLDGWGSRHSLKVCATGFRSEE